MKNTLRENMRRFGTKNLNEASESQQFNPFVTMEDIVVDVMVTGKTSPKTSIVTNSEVHNNRSIDIETTPGTYDINNDIFTVTISGKENTGFECAYYQLMGPDVSPKKPNNTGQGCEIKLSLNDMDGAIRKYSDGSYFFNLQIFTPDFDKKDMDGDYKQISVDINLGKSRFKRK